MIKQSASPYAGPSVPWGSPNRGMQGQQGMPGMTGFDGMMNMMNQMILMQFMTLMTQMMSLISGMSAVSGGSPQFGAGAAGSGSPASFLGSSGAGGASSAGGAAGTAAAGAKDAGGGWINPVGGSYRVSSGFGPRQSPTAGASTNHKGIDLAAPLNTPILAAKAGTVSVSKDEATGYGKWIEIKHDDGTKSRYGHLNSRDVQVGAKVTAGQQIGKMGSTGTSTGSHLHFEVFNTQGVQVDPAKSMKL